MKTMLIAATAILGLAAGSAFAGPSDHSSHKPGDVPRTRPTTVHAAKYHQRAPYSLTGGRPQRRVVQWRDVGKGHGDRQMIPFWVVVAD